LISQRQKLSENFIAKFSRKVNWTYISKCQKLSEKFMKRYKFMIDWYWISRCQKLSEEFIKKYKKKIVIEEIEKNNQIKKNYKLCKILHTKIILNDEIENIKKYFDIKIFFK
jgi:hypothetical protein